MVGDFDSVDQHLLEDLRRLQIECPGLGIKKITQRLAAGQPLFEVTAAIVRTAVSRLEAEASIDHSLLDDVRRLKIESPDLGIKKMTQRLAAGHPLLEVTATIVRMALSRVDAEPSTATLAVKAITHATDGTCLVATRRIEAGDTILDEAPLLQTAFGSEDRTVQCLKAPPWA